MTKKQSGFTVVEILLIVMSLALLTGVGYFVWHKEIATHSTNKIRTASLANSTAKPAYSGSIVNRSLLSLDNASSQVSFVVPDGWVADKDSARGLDFFADDLTYTPGTKFSYSSEVNNRDIERFMLSVTDANGVPKEYKSYKKSDYGTVNGNKAVLYYHKFSSGEHIGNIQMQGGETEHMYFITKGNDAVMVSYYVLAGDKDQQQLINQVINTIRF